MSRAVDTWPDWVRPWAFLKFVLFMPSALAVRFMRSANRLSLPSTASAIAVAASLADLTAAARIKWRSSIFCPARSPSLLGGSLAA